MDKQRDLSDFNKGQIVMAIWQGESISKIAGLVGSRYAVVSNYQKKDNWRTNNKYRVYIDVHGEQSLAHLVHSHWIATMVQISKKKSFRSL